MRHIQEILGAMILMAGLTTLAAGAAPAANEKPAAHPADSSLTQEWGGKITTVDFDSKIVTLRQEDQSKSFVWDDQTRLTEARHAVKPSALEVGVRALILYEKIDGRNVARTIHLMVPPTTQALGSQAQCPMMAPTKNPPAIH